MLISGRYLTLKRILLCLLCPIILFLSIVALTKYHGQSHIYIMFTVVSNLFLYLGFRKNAIFFDSFIAVFFWLGFWLKLTVKVAFANGVFYENVGNFSGSGDAFDHALIVSSCGLVGLILSSLVREKLIFSYPSNIDAPTQYGLLQFYRTHRTLVLFFLFILICAVSFSNIYLGVYQKGSIPRTALPYGISGLYKWLLLFGLASVAALIMKLELEINKRVSYPVVILSLLEGFFSNVSLLSRGMILNTTALIYGLIISIKYKSCKISLKYITSIIIVFLVLFGSSILVVNYVRSSIFTQPTNLTISNSKDDKSTPTITSTPMRSASVVHPKVHNIKKNLFIAKLNTTPLFIDRWVGMEGVMAVTSYPELGWDLWGEAWREVHALNTLSFYDSNFIVSPYTNMDSKKFHYISLPGILAFCYYPGSYWFLFACMFFLGVVASAIEISVFKLGGQNLILCSLIAQVVAYRFSSFGYVPAQSYLLFGTIGLNLFIIYFADKFLLYCYKR